MGSVSNGIKIVGILFLACLLFNFIPSTAGLSLADMSAPGISENIGIGLSVPVVANSQFTGAANVSVPILVPLGRNGIAPKLALTYNSFQKNGWIGVGWNLDLGSIQRSKKFGVCYNCDEYVANVNGSSSELVPRIDWGLNYYGGKVEGAFSKYYKNPSGGWEVYAKDGTKYFFGTSSSSRQQNTHGIYKWCLDRVEDSNGNFMTIAYLSDQSQIYLDEIRYTGNGSLGPSNYIKFHLMDRDPQDAPLMYDTNSEVITAKLLRTIDVKAGGDRVCAYTFDYSFSTDSYRSRLSAIHHYGSNSQLASDGSVVSGTTLPSTDFTWFNGGDGTYTYRSSLSSTGQSVLFADINGDGLADLIKHASGWVYTYLAIGDGQFDTNFTATGGFGHYVRLADVSGDGRADLVKHENDGWVWTYLSNGDGSFASPVATGGSGGNGAGFLNLADLDADGDADLIKHDSDGWVYTFLSNGDGSYEGQRTSGGLGGNGPGRVMFADVNGDGRADMITLGTGGWVYTYLSNGNGYFTYAGATGGYGHSDPGYVHFADVNGDGRADLVKHENDGMVFTSISKGDGTYTDQIATGGWGGNGQGYVGLADVNGDGRADLVKRDSEGWVFTFLSNGSGTYNYHSTTGGSGGNGPGLVQFADINGDGRADLIKLDPLGAAYTFLSNGDGPADHLQTATSSAGTITTIAYARSSQYINHLLPFIIHPVSAITTDDGFGNQSKTTFDYYGGFYKFQAREFRGFESVTQTNPNNTTATTWFFQDDELKGRQIKVESWEYEGGPRISATDFTWIAAAIGSASKFVYLDNKNSKVYENNLLSFEMQVDTNYIYDSSGLYLLDNSKSTVISGGQGEDVTTSYQYNNYGGWLWRKTQQTVIGSISGKVRESYYTYDVNGNLIEEEHWNNNLDDPTNPVIKMKYDDYGNQTESWDAKSSHLYPNNPSVEIQYDPETHTYPVRVMNALNHVAEYGYNYRYGKVDYEIDPNGIYTRYDYDEFGRLKHTRVTNADETELYAQTDVDYHDDVFPRTVVTSVMENDSGSTIDAYEYFDGLGRSVQTISFGENGKPIVTKSRYDAMGRVEQSWGPFFSTFIGYHSESDIPDNVPYMKTDYDLRSRPERIESPLGEDVDSATIAVTTFSYSGLSTTITDPDGGKKTEIKDYLGRVVKVTEYSDAGELYTHYDYNAAGDLLKVTNALGKETNIKHDSLGRKYRMSDPDMDPILNTDTEEGDWKYTYDANGNLITQTDAKEQTITFEYDALNRIKKKRYSTSDPEVNYTYDEASVQNGIGRLYKIENANASTTMDAYDEMGRELSVTRRITGAPLTAYTTTYSYDLSGKVTSMTYPGTTPYQVNYDYHQGSGLLHLVTGITDFTEYAELTSYEPTGKIGNIYHGNQTETVYSYDAKSTRLLEMQTTNPVMADVQHRTYRYTPAGNIKSIVKTSGSQSITYSYEYDKLHRLIGETNTGGDDDFDPSMLIKTYDDSAPIHAVKSVTFNGSSTPYDYEYDGNGNMTTSWDFTDPSHPVERTIEYNADNMPVQITHLRDGNDVRVDLTYDGEGVRVKKTIGGSNSIFYIGDHFEVAGGEEIKYIFAGNLRIAKVTAVEKLFYHKDHLGSTIAITNFSDGSGAETAEYLPFGLFRKHSETEVTNYKFSDQEHDDEVGLYNYNARLYDTAIGIFISPDSIVPDPYDPQTLNRYAYCRNNPLIYVDPSGHDFGLSILIGAAIGAAAGGASAAINDGDVLQGMLMGAVTGAITGGIFYGAGEIIASYGPMFEFSGAAHGLTAIEQAGIHVGAGAISGGINSAITGSDIGAGILSGALSGGVSGYYGSSWSAGRVLVEGAVGGTVAELKGGKFANGAALSVGHALLSYTSYAARKYELNNTPAGSVGNSPGVFDLPGKIAGQRPEVGGGLQPLTGAIILGGNQGGPGFNRFFGLTINYKPGSFWDVVNESFAGIHDFLNGRVFGMYNNQGYYIGGMLGRSADSYISMFNVIVTSPFAAATLTPSYLIK